MSNQIKTAALLALLSVFFIYIGQALGGSQGMIMAFMFAIAFNVANYWFSDKIVLKLYRAQPIEEGHFVQRIIRELAQRGHLPMPRVYHFPSHSPNAFATGRNPAHGVIAVSTGLLKILDEEELKGVLAHELSHIKNRDTLISTFAATMASAIIMLANMAKWAAIFGGHRRDGERGSGGLEILLMAIVAPLAATLIQLAISRSREFEADKSAAFLTKSPHGLISALHKISQGASEIPLEAATPATSHMFIINPISGASFMKLFSTHPSLEDRIERLRELRIHG